MMYEASSMWWVIGDDVSWRLKSLRYYATVLQAYFTGKLGAALASGSFASRVIDICRPFDRPCLFRFKQ